MPEDKNDEKASNENKDEGAKGFTAPASQEELDRIIGQRLERERAKFADYEDVKAKAAEFDKVAESQKTELQKERERADAAEAKAALAEKSALRSTVAADLGVPVTVLSGDDEESLRASAKAALEWRDSSSTKKTSTKVTSLKSGASSSGEETGTSRAAAAVRQLRAGS